MNRFCFVSMLVSLCLTSLLSACLSAVLFAWIVLSILSSTPLQFYLLVLLPSSFIPPSQPTLLSLSRSLPLLFLSHPLVYPIPLSPSSVFPPSFSAFSPSLPLSLHPSLPPSLVLTLLSTPSPSYHPYLTLFFSLIRLLQRYQNVKAELEAQQNLERIRLDKQTRKHQHQSLYFSTFHFTFFARIF